MQTDTKFKLLSLLVGLCLVLVGGLGYYSWQLSQQLDEATSQAPAAVPSYPLSPLPDSWPKTWDPRLDNWDPSGRFSDLQRMMDEMLGNMSPGRSIFNNQGFGFSQSSPRITMEESTEDYTVVVTVPQGQEVELNTELSDNQLKITGKVKNSQEQKGNKLFGGTGSYNTLSASQFSQTMTLPTDVDEAGMTIENDEAKITIRIPKVK